MDPTPPDVGLQPTPAGHIFKGGAGALAKGPGCPSNQLSYIPVYVVLPDENLALKISDAIPPKVVTHATSFSL